MARDDDLVRRAKDGDPQAWRDLYRSHAGRLVTWLRLRPVGDASASEEDVASEAWLVAAAKVADFSGSADDFGGWLFGIARKIAASSRRTAQRRDTHPTATPMEHDAAAQPDHSAQHERVEGLREILAHLSAAERDAVALVDCLGIEPARAAQILGVSGVSLRVARHRGLARLRKQPPAALLALVGQSAT